MEGTPSFEREPLNFLSEKYKVTFSIEPEAVKFLPEVTAEDLQTKKEKYRLLVGEANVSSQEANLHIRGILEMDEEEQKRCYREGVNEVSNINIPEIQKIIKDVQNSYPEYVTFGFLGDIHTHPTTAKDIDGIEPWLPSKGDIESIVDAYESKQLNPEKPYIFGIAAPDENWKTRYSFYRLIQTETGYSYERI